MNKKRIFRLALLFFLLFVIPIPTGVYKDGGTKTYTALTYKIVDWNHIHGNGVYDKLKLYPFPLNFMSIDMLLAREESDMNEVALNQADTYPCKYSKNYANIAFSLPKGFEYSVEDSSDSDEFSLSFWPEGREKGKIAVHYYTAFGVCGTGLEQEEIKLGKYDAYKGTYDGKEVWDYISLKGTAGNYVVMNEGADEWWSDYGDQAMQILSTLIVGDGNISEYEALEIAKSKITIQYNRSWAEFNASDGVWAITFFVDDTLGDDQVITIDADGNAMVNERKSQ